MIYIDASRYGNTDRRTGVENYSFHLINELARLFPNEITLLSPRLIPLPLAQKVIPFPRLWTQIRLSWEVWRDKQIDNLFVPSHVMPLRHPKHTVITIHDVAFHRFPEAYSKKSKAYLEWGARFAVKNAAHIIVPSETTRHDLIEFYKADPKKVSVIPLGFSSGAPSTKTPVAELVGKPYFLYVGRIETKKNTDTLIKAFTLFTAKNQEVDLVLAGFVGHGGQKILDAIPNDLKKRIHITGYLPEDLKAWLMQGALAFIFPSRYEGFGLPLLEAMKHGLPIIASRIPSSYEIAKENALFFDTENAQELNQRMLSVLDSDLRKKIIQNHAETLRQYSWENCAKKTMEVLKNA